MTTQPFFGARIVDDDILVVVIHGSLDAATTPEFDREIQNHLDRGRSRIIIDCRYLSHLSSVAIGRLIMLQKRLQGQGGEVKLATLHGPVAEVIEDVALGKILQIYPDLEFARKSFYPDEAGRRALLRHLAWIVPAIVILAVGAAVVSRPLWIANREANLESGGPQSDGAETEQPVDPEDALPEEIAAAIMDQGGQPGDPSPPNRPPVANDDSYETPKNTQLVVPAPGLLENDGDPDPDDALTVTGIDTLAPLGTIDNWNADGFFTYTPRRDYTGNDTFTYVVGDGESESLPATVTITILEAAESTTDGGSP